ncbi:DNA-formamidopyrimidine glycosylase [Terrilactibacillus sp. BCM23-1]|uniref:Formamidopyrimidine-DNA glycosylase n=1 Tax=Terrilactibacillus tamarindi TaxID=2599694 RepID=A0A6N8CPU7_9BACI|nr:DNA-formamidopyrimidine glycosylase [Terrilactibacillus tamarindi]MTT31678.1 DNA-formamidopyrimidine glycosylase [Terrilactibacillus tamarindi]
MPELPEVETVKRTLNDLIKGKTIQDVKVLWPNIIKKPTNTTEFVHLLSGQTIHQVERRGKFLIFHLDDSVLVSHLRMEGKYRLYQADEPLNKHAHVIFIFNDNTALHYLDVRKFGTMHIFKKGEEERNKPLSQLGPEPFDPEFTPRFLFEKCKRTNRTIKQVLLDQSIVVGLGNIYVDEVLFQAKIHPTTAASNLSREKINDLHQSIVEILTKAITLGGSTIRTYVNSQGTKGTFQDRLAVYGRDDQPCPRCGTLIQKIKVGGRGTHFCPNCQGDM